MMPVVEITQHAVDRYRERIADIDPPAARAAMSTPAVQLAADFGASFVKIATGHRLVVKQHRVITVLMPIKHRRRETLRGQHGAGE